MKTQGRHNVHGKGGVRFKAGWDKGREVSVMRNLTSNLIIHGSIITTFSNAKKVSQYADRMVTFAKKGDLAARREAAKFVRESIVGSDGKNGVQKLFDFYGPKYKNRKGGYTREVKVANRKGDNAPMAVVAFVD